MNETILDKKLKYWEDELLDLGKRNRMISFRETKRTTLKIVEPRIEELYQKLVIEEKELTFQKPIDRDSDVQVYSALSLLDAIGMPVEVCIGDIRGAGTFPEVDKTLKNLRTKAKLMMEEQGVNVLYLVMGFVEWHEKGSRGSSMRSPLLLVPVSLNAVSVNKPYSLRRKEEEIVVNPTLSYLFEKEYEVKLPEFHCGQEELNKYLEKTEEIVNAHGWRIRRSCSLALVSFLKISMYNDLIQNRDLLKKHPVIRAFAGDKEVCSGIDIGTLVFDHDSSCAEETYQVLEADSSQLDALALSRKGISFVLQGPPGTGKSQTIANMIAQGLADGKKILFVSGKKVALDVVYRRLEEVELDEFCLFMHSYKTNRRQVLGELENNLLLKRKKMKKADFSVLTRLDRVKEYLKKYEEELHEINHNTGLSVYETYGAIVEMKGQTQEKEQEHGLLLRMLEKYRSHVQKRAYQERLKRVFTEKERIEKFEGNIHSLQVKNFQELDKKKMMIDRIRIREQLLHQIPDMNHPGEMEEEMAVLLQEVGRSYHQTAIRRLFQKIPGLVLNLKPCFMMSPLSVAYFLDAGHFQFDMVIFDEASQIFPQDALGAILRGKQVIIAGDKKQLPPTNFFAANSLYEEEDEFVLCDSLLEEAGHCLPVLSLLWHYRSCFEELIAFSNREIYQNRLITFPSNAIGVADTGVEYVYVQGGIYANRSNAAEAQEIVRLVQEHIHTYPNRSLGVVTLSIAQQALIEEEIYRYQRAHPEQEWFFREDREEPFFIKNLENVQGDERDTIIFSIAYGKNAQGRMYMRFGPLGQEGGERRLNVAITRAKYNVKLVGSIMPEDIDLSRTRSEGVRMLRSYIQYALNNKGMIEESQKGKKNVGTDMFCHHIADFLTHNGYKIHEKVGNSEYTIDIAVEHPKYPGHFILGIECDGDSYHTARTVRDREYLRANVLEKMGWKMYRIWSTEWMRYPEKEQKKLLEMIQRTIAAYRGESL